MHPGDAEITATTVSKGSGYVRSESSERTLKAREVPDYEQESAYSPPVMTDTSLIQQFQPLWAPGLGSSANQGKSFVLEKAAQASPGQPSESSTETLLVSASNLLTAPVEQTIANPHRDSATMGDFPKPPMLPNSSNDIPCEGKPLHGWQSSVYDTTPSAGRSVYVRPQHPKFYCESCGDFPNGFRGEHELRRHWDRCHHSVKKVWICTQPRSRTEWSPRKPLSDCKYCRQQKKYNVYYNAAAHLLRAHFNPRKRGRKAQGEQRVSRAGKAGDDWPSIDWLKANGWLQEIEMTWVPAVTHSVRSDIGEPSSKDFAASTGGRNALDVAGVTTERKLTECAQPQAAQALREGLAEKFVFTATANPNDHQHAAESLLAQYGTREWSGIGLSVSVLVASESGAPQTTATIPDSGYSSMAKENGAHAEMEVEDFSDSMSICTDNQESTLDTETKDRLASAFVDHLLESLQTTTDMKGQLPRIVPLLPTLLRDYAIAVRGHAHSGVQQGAAIFVRHQRRLIASHFERDVVVKPDCSDVPSLRDKIGLLWRDYDHEQVQNGMMDLDSGTESAATHESQPDWPPYEGGHADALTLLSEPSDSDTPGKNTHSTNSNCRDEPDRDTHDVVSVEPAVSAEVDRVIELPSGVELPEVRAFLTESDEYRLLLEWIKIAGKMMPTGATDRLMRDCISNALASSSSSNVGLSLQLQLQWSPRMFLREQFSTTRVDLRRVIVICGDIKTPQAFSVGEYCINMWPLVADTVLECMQTALDDAGLGRAGMRFAIQSQLSVYYTDTSQTSPRSP